VTLTGHTGQGNLLCELLDGNLLNVGMTLQNLITELLAVLNA